MDNNIILVQLIS